MELKRSIEALLFASAKRLTTHEIAVLTRKPDNLVEEKLKELEQEIKESDRPVALQEDHGTWRLQVKDQFIPVIRKVVTKTELPKSILETLAVVAYKAPVLQSKVVGIRTNKAYDHLAYLEKTGFITREKHGRTKLIKLAQKFYDYFDVNPDKLESKFKNAEQIEKAIEKKEKEVEGLEEYQTVEPITDDLISTAGVEPYREKMGTLDVVEIPEKETEYYEPTQKEHVAEPEVKKKEKPKPESKGLYPEGMSQEMQEKVDKRVADMLIGPEKEPEE